MDQRTQLALQDLYQMSTIPFLVFDEHGKDSAAFPTAFSGFYKESFLLTLVHLLKEAKQPNGVFLYQLEEFYYCAITMLSTNCYLVTAPISSSNLGADVMLRPILQFVNFTQASYFQTLISQFPIISTYRLGKFVEISRLVYGSSPADGTYIKHNASADTIAQSEGDMPCIVSAAEGSVCIENSTAQKVSRRHHAPSFDIRMSKTIIDGDAEAFLREQRKPFIGTVGQMSFDSLRQAKYTFVCAIFSISRAAIEGGLPSEYALELSDMYCQRMDTMETKQEIEHLLVSAGVDYCHKVKQYRSQHEYSAYTKVVLEYVRSHLFEPIKMDSLVFEASLNRRSLSLYFRKDTGLSISEYIMQQRLEEAKSLLGSTNLAIVQISELLQFSSQSYFGKKYRDYWGVTPKEYRDSLPLK